MYFVELKIVPDSGAPLTPGRRAEHSVHQHVYQVLGVIVRPFFEDNGLVDIGSARMPQMMTELTCLHSEPLPASESMRLEARLACASEEGFSVDYGFYSDSDGRLLAAWRSLHIFYDFELELPLIFETSLENQASRLVGLGTAQAKEPSIPLSFPH
jgi:hypothetical protein